MKPFLSILMLMLLAVTSMSALAMPMEAYEFDSPAQEQTFRKLNSELRCLVCQNQAISDSDAGLAKDLRAEIHSMLLAGKTEQQIVAFMVERYGDYVLYNPPIKPMTLMLWFGPALVFIIALFYVIKFIRSQNKNDTLVELTSEESERLRNLQADTEVVGDGQMKDKQKQGDKQ